MPRGQRGPLYFGGRGERLKNPPLLMSPGPPTATERPWERSPGPEGEAEGSPVPVATRARSGAAAGGTGWQTRAGSLGPKGRGQLLATAGTRLAGPPPRLSAPVPPPEQRQLTQLQAARLLSAHHLGTGVSVQHRVLSRAGLSLAQRVLPLSLPLSPCLGSSAFPEGLAGEENRRLRDWMRDPGCGCLWGARNPLASLPPSHATASFTTSLVPPGKTRRGGRCTGCEPLCSVPSRANVTCICVYLMPPSPTAWLSP